MSTNRQVKDAFARRDIASSTNLRSDGTSLWSYGWWEVARWVDGDADGGPHVVLRNGKSYSMTTATKHRSGVLGELSPVITPPGRALINLSVVDGGDLPPCVESMQCYCAGHARGNAASEPCDTSEVRQ